MKIFLLSIVAAILLTACGDTFGHTTRQQIRADRDIAVASEQRQASEAWAHSLRDGVSNIFRFAMWAAIVLFVAAFVSHIFSSGSQVSIVRIKAGRDVRLAEIYAGVQHARIAADDRARLMDFLERTDARNLQSIAVAQFEAMTQTSDVTVVECGIDQITGHKIGALVANGEACAYRLLTG